jgi:hypothetical protein
LTSYILVDFENVQPKELSALRGGAFKVMVFVGPAQTSVKVDLAEQLYEFAPPGLSPYVRVRTRGPNALDMHIAITSDGSRSGTVRRASTSFRRIATTIH